MHDKRAEWRQQCFYVLNDGTGSRTSINMAYDLIVFLVWGCHNRPIQELWNMLAVAPGWRTVAEGRITLAHERGNMTRFLLSVVPKNGSTKVVTDGTKVSFRLNITHPLTRLKTAKKNKWTENAYNNTFARFYLYHYKPQQQNIRNAQVGDMPEMQYTTISHLHNDKYKTNI